MRLLLPLLCYIGQLKTVTRKSSSGALHITFQSSSSSESSSESSSTSSSESSESDTTVSKNQRNNAVTSRVSIGKVANIVQKLSPSVKAAPASGNRSPAAGAKGDNVTDVSANRRGRRKRKKSLPTNITVGGDRDVLTTKSTLYKSPVLNNKLPGTSSKLKNSSSNSQSPAGTAADKMKKTTFPIRSTKIAGGKETEKSISQWDVQPTATAAVVGPSLPIAMAVNSAPVSVQQPPAAEQPILHPPQDYSTLPELQGPPRPGDKLAFKVRLFFFCRKCPFPTSLLLLMRFRNWKCLQATHQ